MRTSIVAIVWLGPVIVAGCGTSGVGATHADGSAATCALDDCTSAGSDGGEAGDGASVDARPADSSDASVDAHEPLLGDAASGPTHAPAACHIVVPTVIGKGTAISRPRPMWTGTEHLFIVRAPVTPGTVSPAALHLVGFDATGVRTRFQSLGIDGMALSTTLVQGEIAVAFDNLSLSPRALRFARFASNGDVVASPKLVAYGLRGSSTDMAWTGAHYALLWNGSRLALLSSAGAAVGAPMLLGAAGLRYDGTLSWTGTELGSLWTGPSWLAEPTEAQFARAAPDGTRLIAPVTLHSSAGPSSVKLTAAALAWTGAEYVAALMFETGELGLTRLSSAGTIITSTVVASVSALAAKGNLDLLWNGSDLALAWTDSVASGATEIWMRRFDGSLVPHGPATRVTDLANELGINGAPIATFPRLAWAGDEYVVSFDAAGNHYLRSVCD